MDSRVAGLLTRGTGRIVVIRAAEEGGGGREAALEVLQLELVPVAPVVVPALSEKVPGHVWLASTVDPRRILLGKGGALWQLLDDNRSVPADTVNETTCFGSDSQVGHKPLALQTAPSPRRLSLSIHPD